MNYQEVGNGEFGFVSVGNFSSTRGQRIVLQHLKGYRRRSGKVIGFPLSQINSLCDPQRVGHCKKKQKSSDVMKVKKTMIPVMFYLKFCQIITTGVEWKKIFLYVFMEQQTGTTAGFIH